jgi:hypothetical protein
MPLERVCAHVSTGSPLTEGYRPRDFLGHIELLLLYLRNDELGAQKGLATLLLPFPSLALFLARAPIATSLAWSAGSRVPGSQCMDRVAAVNARADHPIHILTLSSGKVVNQRRPANFLSEAGIYSS